VRFYHSADIVWTVSQGTAQTLRSYGYQKAIEIMPNGTDLSKPSDIPGARAMVEARYGLLPDERVLLFVGQHILQKNLMLLIEAFALVARMDHFVKLLMVGDGYAKKQLHERVVALGISRRVIFADVVRDRDVLTAIYLRADLFTFPSVYDNAPLVVREAASAGCPAVLISGSNAAEGTRDGFNAFLCDETAASLCQAIQRALQNEALRHEVANRAAETLGRTWDDIIRDVGNRYREIIRDYQPKPMILVRQLDRKNRDVLRIVILRQLQQAKAAGEKNLLALKRLRSFKGSRSILWMPNDQVDLLKIFPLLPDPQKRRHHHENPDD
jgi:glycosyltransferase involved in cell wall biosynthesis